MLNLELRLSKRYKNMYFKGGTILYNHFKDMSIPDNLYKKKKKNSYSFSVIFLIIIIVSTVILFVYNKSILTDIDKLKGDIIIVDDLTENIKKDKKVQIYSLIEANKKTLERMKYASQIPDFIEHFKLIGKKYKINLENFNYSGGKLTTEVLFEDIKTLTYIRVVNFIKEYRLSEDALFDLHFISGIKGEDNIKFAISLELKEPIKKNEKKNNVLDNKRILKK